MENTNNTASVVMKTREWPERLQQMERDMVRDLQKEKTLGGD